VPFHKSRISTIHTPIAVFNKINTLIIRLNFVESEEIYGIDEKYAYKKS
jgi:hypothetical protein